MHRPTSGRSSRATQGGPLRGEDVDVAGAAAAGSVARIGYVVVVLVGVLQVRHRWEVLRRYIAVINT